MEPKALPFESLFSTLRAADYYWSPLSPERWMRQREQARANPASFDPWVRCFGLGLEVPEGEFNAADLNNFTIKNNRSHETLLTSIWGVSRTDDVFIAHSHSRSHSRSHSHSHSMIHGAYIGQETATLIECMKRHRTAFQGQNVLDLGCGAGALSLSIASQARSVLGLDCSNSATHLAQASACAQGFHHLDFQPLAIGSAAAEKVVSARGPWHAAVMNPPMAIPEFSSRPERDGGHFGIELPLQFLDFARRHLVKGAPIFMLATNPVTRKSREGLFFEALRERSSAWSLDDSTSLDRRFNHSLARKHRYAEQGIERIELWYLKLIKI